MANVQLSDLYNPLSFADGLSQKIPELNAFMASGVMTNDAQLAQLASGGGFIGEMPYFNDLDRDDPNLTSDDPAVKAVASNFDSDKTQYRLAKLHKSWSVMQFASELGRPDDPMGHVVSRVAAYWAAVQQKRLINSVNGIIADNKANDGGSMGETFAATITEMSIEQAAQTMGDHKEALAAIAVHSAVETQLRGLKAIRDFHDPETGALIGSTFNGRRIVVDDSLPVVGNVATSVLFAQGSVAYADVPSQVPSEIDRDPNAGNGGGQDDLHSRQNMIIHPYGMSFTSTTVAANTASNAELALAANWDRKYDRKNIGIAFLETNLS